MQAEISAVYNCQCFPQVTSRNLPALAGNFFEAFIFCARANFIKPMEITFYPVPKNLTKVMEKIGYSACSTSLYWWMWLLCLSEGFFSICWSGFKLKFSRFPVLRKRLQLDSRKDLTTKRSFLQFFQLKFASFHGCCICMD